MNEEKRIIGKINEIRKVLSHDDFYCLDADNIASIITSIMMYCELHESCVDCIFFRHDGVGCCFKPLNTNSIPENWNFKSEV